MNDRDNHIIKTKWLNYLFKMGSHRVLRSHGEDSNNFSSSNLSFHNKKMVFLLCKIVSNTKKKKETKTKKNTRISFKWNYYYSVLTKMIQLKIYLKRSLESITKFSVEVSVNDWNLDKCLYKINLNMNIIDIICINITWIQCWIEITNPKYRCYDISWCMACITA